MKRAIVGGFTKVFEVARCFRNEGMDASHLQDFSMIEGYCAYFNYKDNMVFLQNMLCHIITKIFGSSHINIGERTIDFTGEWKVVSFRELILADCGIDIDKMLTAKDLLDEIIRNKIDLESETKIELLGRGNLIDLLYKKVSRPQIIEPTFLIEHPTSLFTTGKSK